MKLTNKQLRQIIKEELEAVMGEATQGSPDINSYPLNSYFQFAKQIKYQDIHMMGDPGEQKQFVQLRDEPNSYLVLVGSSADETVVHIYVNHNGTTYNLMNNKPKDYAQEVITDLENAGFSRIDIISRESGLAYKDAIARNQLRP